MKFPRTLRTLPAPGSCVPLPRTGFTQFPLAARVLLILGWMLFPAGCTPVFETDADVRARQALFDLMEIQEAYHREHNQYAHNLIQIEQYNLKYHTGIVYLEIESAERDRYRAVSLPAESTTARVFAYDTDRGGYYEMGEEEVSRYVLGALSFIRGEKRKQNLNLLLASVLIGALVILGLRFSWRYKGKENLPALGSYLAGLVPLAWSVATLNSMDKNVVFSSQITVYSAAALGLALLSFLVTLVWMKKRNLIIVPSPLVGLAVCTLIVSVFSTGVVIHTFARYYPG